MADDCCASCRFYEAGTWAEYGFCLRYPPSIHVVSEDYDSLSFFPEVFADQWCGEFSASADPGNQIVDSV